MISGKNIIACEQSANGSNTYRTFDPLLNMDNEWQFIEATDSEIDLAVEKAVQAFETYSKKSGSERGVFLNQIADEIEALGDELIAAYCKETGLAEGRAKNERGRTVGQLRMFAKLVVEGSWVQATIDNGQPERQPMAKPDLRKMLFPIGPIVVFGASNFPLAYSTAGGDTASALASGCPVIVKSHPMHAGTGELVASAIVKAVSKTGMPKGVFSNLNSTGHEVGQKLVEHPKVKGVGFTGSIKGGRALYDIAAKRDEPIPVFAEMGSINPVVFLPRALAEKKKEWAKTYAGSITLGTGQFCTNPGLMLALASDDLDEFIALLSKEILDIAPMCMLNPGIKNNYATNKGKMMQQQGLTVVADYSQEVKTNFAQQAVTKVSGAEFLENSTLHQEVFGPFSMIVACKDVHELTLVISTLEGQLTGTVVSVQNEIKDYEKVVTALQSRVGRLIFNGVPTGVQVCAAMMHGGPYPASTDNRFTAVGIHSINRWVRPVSFQDWPNELLPNELKKENPLGIKRNVDGNWM
ncbi:MAG: aldehyde dehydrogenase (NADP(+)) [Croceitalea sp.]|nr:aldehyde dehydrogenase (NADP(+)) [Croceitalea sp.]